MTDEFRTLHSGPAQCCTPLDYTHARPRSDGSASHLRPKLARRASGRGVRWPLGPTARVWLATLACGVVACGAGESGGPVQGGLGGVMPGGPGVAPGVAPQNSDGSPNAPIDPNIIGGLPSGGPSAGGTAPEECDNVLEVTYRDFNESHPDFEMPFSGDEVRLQLIEASLDASGKPTFRDSIGCPWSRNNPAECGDWRPTEKVIESKASFDQWYNTVEGVNIEFQKQLTLTETAPRSGVFVYESGEFFPLSPDEGFGRTPANGQGRNYLFTTEIHLMFTYVAGQTFSFRGDDDLWIFINNKLALDLGSMHNPAEGTIDFDAQAEALGIRPQGVYRMDVFHAERHTQVSSFRIETNIGCFTPAPPRRVL